MKLVRFRKHRGSLEYSMRTAMFVSSVKDIAIACTDETTNINPDLIEIVPYMGYDYRVGWYTYVVRYPGYGVLGFTDGDIKEQA